MKNNKPTILKTIIAILTISILLIGFIACSARNGEYPDYYQVTNKEANGSISNQIKPSEDFYQSINKSLIEEKLTQGFGRWNWKIEFEIDSNNKIQGIIRDLVEMEESLADGSIEKNILSIYYCAKGSSKDQGRQWNLLVDVMRDIRTSTTVQDYVNAVADYTHKYGKDNLFCITIAPDSKNTKEYSAYLELPSLSLEQKSYEHLEETEEYKQYVSKANGFFMLLGKTDAEAEYSVKQLIEFEKNFALLKGEMQKYKGTDEEVTTYTSDELAKIITNINVYELLKHMGFEQEQKLYTKESKKLLELMNEYLSEESLQLLKEYSMYCIYREFDCGITYGGMNSESNMDVVEESSEVDIQAVWTTTQVMSEEIGQLYARKYLTDDSKEDIQAMIQDILQQYDKNISKLTWMSDITKQQARKKLASIQVELGSPKQLPEYKQNLLIKSVNQGGSLLSNLLEIEQKKTMEAYSKLQQTNSAITWRSPTYAADAYYDEKQNTIFLPAANFQPPFYDENADYATNLGGVGVLIAHEISHAFDVKGSRYDSDGNQINWWLEEDRDEYLKRTQLVVDYYNSLQMVPGVFVNGDITLDENIADLGAISCVTALLTKEEDLKKLYVNYAYCKAEGFESDDLAALVYLTNDHAHNTIRVNAVLSSNDLFYDVYDVVEKDGMYVPPEKRVSIW